MDPTMHQLTKIYGGGFRPIPNITGTDDLLHPDLIFKSTYKCFKVIVFDLDETIGSFSDLFILWSGIESLKHYFGDGFGTSRNVSGGERLNSGASVNEFDITNELSFNEILDLYPEFVRPGMLIILDFLLHKKRTGECAHIYIYTNNQCVSGNHFINRWCWLISQYFDYKLKYPQKVFDKIIYAFKINNKIVNTSRTTTDKTHDDFIKCTLLPKNTEICFIDNTYYDKMTHDKVYYIQPKSFYHHLSKSEMIRRLMESPIIYNFVNANQTTPFRDELISFIDARSRPKPMSVPNIKNELLVSQKLMYHIREFFYLTSRKEKTRKNRLKLGKFTRKKPRIYP